MPSHRARIAERREHAAVADDIEVRHPGLEPAPRVAHVADGERVNRLGVVVTDARVDHAERPEDALGGEPPERLPRGARDDNRQQHVAGVAVQEFRARLEVERALAPDQIEQATVGQRTVGGPAGEGEQAEVVAQAAGVVQQMAERDRPAEVRHLRHVRSHVVVERDDARVGEERDGRGGELFGDRGEIEDRVGGDRRARVEVGEAVAAGEDNLALVNERGGAARRSAGRQLRQQPVDRAGRRPRERHRRRL